MPTIPLGPWLPDVPDYANPGLLVCRNCVPGPNGYEPFLDANVIIQTPLNGIVLGAASTANQDGFARTYAGTPSSLYEITQAPADVSKAGGYTLGTEEYWQFAQFNDRIIAVSFNTDTQSKLFTDPLFSDLAGSPKGAAIGNIGNDFVFIGNINDPTDGALPNRIQWSAFRDPTSWTPGTNLSDFRDLRAEAGPIAAIVGGDIPTVFQRRAINRMAFVGGQDIWEFTEVEQRRGAIAPRSVVSDGRYHFFLSDDSFYLFDGTESHDIGQDQIATTFFKNLDQSTLPFVQGVVDTIRHRMIWLHAQSTGQSAFQARTGTHVIIYDWHQKRWSEAEVALDTIFPGVTTGWTLEDLNVYGGLEDVPVSLDSNTWVGGAEQLQGFDTSHRLINFTGSPLTALYETGEIALFEHRTAVVDDARPIADGTVLIDVAQRPNQQATPVWAGQQSLDDNGKADFNLDGRYHRARLVQSGDWTKAQAIEFTAWPSGERA